MKRMNSEEKKILIAGIFGGSFLSSIIAGGTLFVAYDRGCFSEVQEMHVTDASWEMEVPVGVMETQHRSEKRRVMEGEPDMEGIYNVRLVHIFKGLRVYEYDIDVFSQTRTLTFSGEGTVPTEFPYIDLSDSEIIGNVKLNYFISGEIDDNDVKLSINPEAYDDTIVGRIYEVKVTPRSNEVVYIKSKY